MASPIVFAFLFERFCVCKSGKRGGGGGWSGYCVAAGGADGRTQEDPSGGPEFNIEFKGLKSTVRRGVTKKVCTPDRVIDQWQDFIGELIMEIKFVEPIAEVLEPLHLFIERGESAHATAAYLRYVTPVRRLAIHESQIAYRLQGCHA
ncbi:hypothetical protein PsorP6_015343 [Peronosclerospora sorghi]|uniref:Uncharacterized protein n=1 Tax=Peronosclerospora sorghi TaxID=230839 RepID=A0ACC0VR60_9STRA|nr:hypothetical protein PsorP6_015343 [Peronosclerospora sorghi]